MLLMPMDVPAEIHRVDAAGVRNVDAVARGPLVIMAHGLMAIDPARRRAFMIRSALGEMDAAQAEAVLRRWSVPQSHLD
jgi:hypothetical protein